MPTLIESEPTNFITTLVNFFISHQPLAQHYTPTRNLLRWGCVESVWVHVNVGRSPWLLRMGTEREFVEPCARPSGGSSRLGRAERRRLEARYGEVGRWLEGR